MHEYDQIFDWYAAIRTLGAGVSDVAESARTLASGSTILDLGCGPGIPMSQILLQSGFEPARSTAARN
jgi:hypothetical protein